MQRRWAPGAGQWIEPSKQPLAEWLEIWVGGLRIQPSTRARYRHDIRSHIVPYIGAAPLASLTSAKLDTLYRELEASGCRNSKGERTGKPLSPRTVRSVATILGAALKAAVSAEPPLLARNPAVKAKPPTAKEAQAAAPEMNPWTADQLRRFLNWARDHSSMYAAWYLLAYGHAPRGAARAALARRRL